MMKRLTKYKEYFPLFILFFSYIFILTVGLPYYFRDYINLYFMSGNWSYDMLSIGYEFYFRPLENLAYYVFSHLFEEGAFAMRVWKGALTAGISLMVYYFINKETGERKIAFMGAFFFITALATLESVMLIYDFEIVNQFLLLIATYFFFKAYNDKKPSWKHIIICMAFVYFALLSKESAKVFVGIMILFVLGSDWKKLKYWAVPLSILLFLVVKPGFLLGIESPPSGTFLYYLTDWLRLENLFLLLKYFVIYCFGIIVALIYIFSMYLFRKSKISTEKSIDGWKERIQGKNSTILFFGLWFFATAGLMVLVPLAEKRYAIVPLLPFFIVSFIIIGKGYKQYITKKRIILILFWILILSTLLVNVGMGLKYRYGFGNFVITTTEGWSFIENNYNDSYVVYLDTSTYFLPYGGKSNNTEIIYQEYNEIKNNLSADTQISFLGTKGPINEAEQDSTKLQETFVYGPYCSMVYEAGENNVQTVSLQEKGKTSLTYDFPKETTISYCSLLLETTFYLPKEVEITVVSEEGNITKKINPTVGRYQACEFACPTFENITIQGVEISWDSGFLREVNSGKIRFVEEE